MLKSKSLKFVCLLCIATIQQAVANAQYFKIKSIRDLSGEYSFPFIANHTPASKKINDCLWAMQMNVLPETHLTNSFSEAGLPEKGSNQGVTSIGYKILRNDAKCFSIQINSEYTSAGLNEYEHIYNFDPQTGNPVILMTFFTKEGFLTLREKIIENRKQRLGAFLKTLDMPSNGNTDANTYNVYFNCLQSMDDEDPNEDDMNINGDTINLVMKPCSNNHYFQATDTADVYQNRLTFPEIQSYLNDYGKCFFSNKKNTCGLPASLIKDNQVVYYGVINEKLPITLVIFNYYENTCSAAYFYNKYGKKISLSGTVEEDGSLKLQEQIDNGKPLKGLFYLKRKADGSFEGTWSNGVNTFPVTLH